MNTIWKYTLQPALGMISHDIPTPHTLRSFQVQNGLPCMWVEMNPSDSSVRYRFITIGTGHPVPDNSDYIGTYLDGPFVWHVYRIALGVPPR
jgi:hypothetical protein